MDTKTHCRKGHEVVLENQVACLECGASTRTLRSRMASPFVAAYDSITVDMSAEDVRTASVVFVCLIGAAGAILIAPEEPWTWVVAALLVVNCVRMVGIHETAAAAALLFLVAAPIILFPIAAVMLVFGWY